MYILADVKWNCKNSRFIYEQRQLLKKYLNKKFVIFVFYVFFYLKDLIFYKYICKMYKL